MKLSQNSYGGNDCSIHDKGTLNANGIKERDVPSMVNGTRKLKKQNRFAKYAMRGISCNCSISSFNLAKQLLLPVESQIGWVRIYNSD